MLVVPSVVPNILQEASLPPLPEVTVSLSYRTRPIRFTNSAGLQCGRGSSTAVAPLVPRTYTVSHWSPEGASGLSAGDWVQVGTPNRVTRTLSGAVELGYPNVITTSVPAGALRAPVERN